MNIKRARSILALWRPWKLFSLFGNLVEQFSNFGRDFHLLKPSWPFGSHSGLLPFGGHFVLLEAILAFW